MKRLVFLCLMLIPAFCDAQYIAIGANLLDTTTERYVQNSPTNITGNRRAIEKIRDSAYWSIRTHRAFIRAVDSLHAEVNNPLNLLWVSGFGEVRRANISSLILDTSLTYATKAWVQSRGYLTSFTQQNADWNAVSGVAQILNKPTIPAAQVNSDWNSISGVSQILNKPTIPSTTTQISEGSNLYYTTTRARSSLSAGAGINYDPSTGIISNSSPGSTTSLTAGRGIAITGTAPNYTISLVIPTVSIVTRPTGTAPTTFTISSTKEALATYTLTCTVTNPLLVGTSSASAFLEYSLNGGTTWVSPSSIGNSSGVGVTVTLQLTNGQTGTLIGMIPANALVRIRTVVSGTASLTYITGQETVY